MAPTPCMSVITLKSSLRPFSRIKVDRKRVPAWLTNVIQQPHRKPPVNLLHFTELWGIGYLKCVNNFFLLQS